MRPPEGFASRREALAAYYDGQDWSRFDRRDVRRALEKRTLDTEDLGILLSPAGGRCLEELAAKAREITLRHFGRTQQVYAPLYLSDSCVNHCVYCGFRASRERKRSRLSPEQIRRQGEILAAQGLRQILLLTGEDPRRTPACWLAGSLAVLRDLFGSIGIEVFPMEQGDYERMVAAGAASLTLYQETYNRDLYARLHPRGPKRDFLRRLEAPARGGRAGFRQITIGALLGLDRWRREVFLMAHHGRFLQRQFPGTEVGFAFPRIRPASGGFTPAFPVDDRGLVQALTVCRIFQPRAGISLSTREPAALRDHMLPLGVTRLSAGSSTAVGGYGGEVPGEGQFDTSDKRSIREMDRSLRARGYQPVYQDRSLL